MNIYLHKRPKRLNAVSGSMILIAALLGYLLYFYVPLWWPVFRLTGIMRGICSDAYRIYDNELLMKNLLKEAQRVRLPGLSAENFDLRRTPYEAEELTGDHGQGATADRRGKRCELSFHYERDAVLPFIGYSHRFTWDKEVSADLKFVKWDKQNECSCVRLGE